MEISQPGAHIDHMLRQTRMQNMQLSAMADIKANLLLTISSLVLGFSLSHLSNKGVDAVFIILTVTSITTIALAIYSTMPKVGTASFLKKPRDRGRNDFTLLFFGDYVGLSYEEFENEMANTMNNPSLTYQVQLKEIYNTGCYLAKHKYNILRLAYLAFLCGILSSAIYMFAEMIII